MTSPMHALTRVVVPVGPMGPELRRFNTRQVGGGALMGLGGAADTALSIAAGIGQGIMSLFGAGAKGAAGAGSSFERLVAEYASEAEAKRTQNTTRLVVGVATVGGLGLLTWYLLRK